MTLRETIDELVDAWRAGDALRACAFFAPDGAYCEAGGQAIAGRDALLAHFQRFFRDGPPWRFEIDDVVIDGERGAVFYRFSVKGATGWRESAGCALVRREGGLVSLWREYSA
jgi:uncharacterized protein (TIGR02246 family)